MAGMVAQLGAWAAHKIKDRIGKGGVGNDGLRGYLNHKPYQYGKRIQYLKRDASTYVKYGASNKSATQEQRDSRYADGYYGPGAYHRRRRVHHRRRHGYRGRGDYEGPGAFEQMGGMGDYGDINSNAIVMGTPKNSAGIVSHTALASNMNDSGDITISHKEFVQNVVIIVPENGSTSSIFTNQSFNLNPGLQATFPFMSQIAQNFTLYSMMGLMFQYKPTSGEMGINSQQLGKVIMATDYDPDAQPFINSVQMENYQFSNSAKPSIGQIHGVECKPTESLLDMKYVRTGKSTKDKALTDIGLFQMATEGIPLPTGARPGSSIVIGELWATYTVKVSRANLYSSLLGLNVATYQSLAKPQAVFQHVTDLTTVPLEAPVSTILSTANNIAMGVKFFQAYTDGTTLFGPSLVITWPQNTILGTYIVEIDCTTEVAGIIPGAWLPSVFKQTSAGAPSLNASNQQTQWGCPFDPSNLTESGNLLAPPSVDPNGIPSGSGTRQFKTVTAIGSGPTGSEASANANILFYMPFATTTVDVSAQAERYDNYYGITSSLTPVYTGVTTRLGFQINAPGLNTAKLVLDYVPVGLGADRTIGATWGATSSPLFDINDSFRVRVTSTNSNIATL